MDKISKELAGEVNELISKFIESKKDEILLDISRLLEDTKTKINKISREAKTEINNVISSGNKDSKKILDEIEDIQKTTIRATNYITKSAKIIGDIELMTIKNMKFVKKYGK